MVPLTWTSLNISSIDIFHGISIANKCTLLVKNTSIIHEKRSSKNKCVVGNHWNSDVSCQNGFENVLRSYV